MSARGTSVFAVASVALLAAGSFAAQAAQPRTLVVVARHDLRAGQRLISADLTSAAEPDGGRSGRQLLPASMIGLVPGEILSQPVIAGSPILAPDIRPHASPVTALPNPAGLRCGN